MGESSAIEWTDHTFNPWTGCAKVSTGCANCYAEALSQRFGHLGEWGPGRQRKRTSGANWRGPLRWDRKASGDHRAWEERALRWSMSACPAGVGQEHAVDSIFLGGACDQCAEVFGEDAPRRPRVFCASLADWLDGDGVPVEWLADLLCLISRTPNLDWLLLTKRPERWRPRLLDVLSLDAVSEGALALAHNWVHGRPPANVWIGTSVEDQAAADKRIPELLKIPARIRFLSCEPLLGLVELSDLWEEPFCQSCASGGYSYGEVHHDGISFCEGHGEERVWGVRGIHQVIAGGESGPGARPMHPDWARSLRDQCDEAGVAFFFKQWGAWDTDSFDLQRDDPDCRRLPMVKGDGRRWLNLAGGHGFHGERVVWAQRKGKKKTGRLLDGRTWDEVPS